MLQDLMSEAMEEIDGQPAVNSQQNGDDLSATQVVFWFVFFCTDTWKSLSDLNFTSSHCHMSGGHEECSQDLEPPHSDLFLFPDESGNLTQESSPTYPVLHSPLITPVPNLAQETDDFCILETPGLRREVRKCSFPHLLVQRELKDVHL